MSPDNLTQFAIVTTIVTVAGIVLGNVVVILMEGQAVMRAFDNMARQPSIADRISGQLIVLLAIIETGAIYVLLICLILLFANPFRALFGF